LASLTEVPEHVQSEKNYDFLLISYHTSPRVGRLSKSRQHRPFKTLFGGN